MKILPVALALLFFASLIAAGWNWSRARQLSTENAQLAAQLAELKTQLEANTEARGQKLQTEQTRLQQDVQEVARLRNEVRQLRESTKDSEKIRAENQQLRTALSAANSAAAAINPGQGPTAQKSADHFPKENWTFSGYNSPEAALVSAIWSMKEGNPKAYLESLSPEEQQRMGKIWENKSEQEVAAKHQSDVSAITGMRILDHQDISANEVQMNVYVEGVGRMEKVRMLKMGDDWKFGGYIRAQPK
jgi:myosin heavy subunit